MKMLCCTVAVCGWLTIAVAAPGSPAENQPLPILGIAHVGLRVSNLDNSHAFYSNILGFVEAFDKKTDDGTVTTAFFKVNDDQFIELSPGLTAEDMAPMTHIALRTDDLEKLRAMLLQRGVNAGPIHKRTEDGNLVCDIHDLPGQNLQYLEFIQYAPDSPERQCQGQALGTNRISVHIEHAGIIATNYEAAWHFYVDKFGCRESWSRKQDDGRPSIDHLNLPGASGDFLELSNRPRPVKRASAASIAHFAMTVPDAHAVSKLVLERGAKHFLAPRFGMDKRWQFNLFDPDGTRTECMQPESPDGKP